MKKISLDESDKIEEQLDQRLDNDEPVEAIRFLEETFGHATFKGAGYSFKDEAVRYLQTEVKRLVHHAEDHLDLSHMDEVENILEHLDNINHDDEQVVVYDLNDAPADVYPISYPPMYHQLLDDLVDHYNNSNENPDQDKED